MSQKGRRHDRFVHLGITFSSSGRSTIYSSTGSDAQSSSYVRFFPAVTRDRNFSLRIRRRLRCGRLRLFLRYVEHAGLPIPVVQDVWPLLAALSKLGTLKIQDDLPAPVNLLILLPALFPERINGALQHGILRPDLRKNLHEIFGLLHAAFTTLHV